MAVARTGDNRIGEVPEDVDAFVRIEDLQAVQGLHDLVDPDMFGEIDLAVAGRDERAGRHNTFQERPIALPLQVFGEKIRECSEDTTQALHLQMPADGLTADNLTAIHNVTHRGLPVSEKNVFRARLLRWGESSASGRTVTFRLPDDTEEHPFKGLPVGSRNGQLVEIEIELIEGDLPLETLTGKKAPSPRVGPSVQIIRETAPSPTPVKAPRAHIIDKRQVAVRGKAKGTVMPAAAAPAKPQPAPKPVAAPRPATADKTPIPAAWAAPARPAARPPALVPAAAFAPAPYIPQALPTSAPAPSAMPSAPPPMVAAQPVYPAPAASMSAPQAQPMAPVPAPDMTAFAGRMSQAAEALATAAQKIGTQQVEEEGHSRPRFPLLGQDEDEDQETVGVRTVKRAVDLCTSVDKKRAGFFYYMRALYPTVPTAENDGAAWSRDAKATRDRVCFHCEMKGIAVLADDPEARKRFQELEHAFEKHERLR